MDEYLFKNRIAGEMSNIIFIYLHALSPVLSLLVSIVIQFIGLRSIVKNDFYKSTWFGFYCGLFFLLGLEVFYVSLEQRPTVDLVANIFVNCACFFMMQICYFLFVNSAVCSLRLRILDELSQSKKGLTLAEIFQNYNPEEIIQNRIDKWSNARQIYLKENRCYIDRRLLLYIAKVFDCMKIVIFGVKIKRAPQKADY
jgi:hypothetical protein